MASYFFSETDPNYFFFVGMEALTKVTILGMSAVVDLVDDDVHRFIPVYISVTSNVGGIYCLYASEKYSTNL